MYFSVKYVSVFNKKEKSETHLDLEFCLSPKFDLHLLKVMTYLTYYPRTFLSVSSLHLKY